MYHDAAGHRLEIAVGDNLDHVELVIQNIGDLRYSSLNIPATDIPAIALAMLRAAGVEPHTGTGLVQGDRRDMWAVRYLTDHVEAQAEDAAEKELTRRRIELAAELVTDGTVRVRSSFDPDTPMGKAIDMIIRLQDQAKAKS